MPPPTDQAATAAFIRRTLAPHLDPSISSLSSTPRPIADLLPPLTSSNDVDHELYAALAVVVRETVQTWYAPLTPDRTFVDAVVQTVAHCTRALEQRLRGLDLLSLAGDELAELVEAHVVAFRTAHHDPLLDAAPALHTHPHDVYHTLRPHPALSPVPHPEDPEAVAAQAENEAVWRQLLVQAALAVLLPTEDLENECLRALVTDIFAEIILKTAIAETACQSWTLWGWIAKAAVEARAGTIRAVSRDDEKGTAQYRPKRRRRKSMTTQRLERFGLLSSTDADAASQQHDLSPESASPSLSAAFWTIAQYVILAGTVLRVALVALATAWTSSPPVTEKRAMSDAGTPILNLRAWSCAATVLELRERMPWLTGALTLGHRALLHGPGRVGDAGKALDRILTQQLHIHVAPVVRLAPLLSRARAALLPRNALPRPSHTPPPSPAQLATAKRRAARAVLRALPESVRARLFHPAETTPQVEDVIVDEGDEDDDEGEEEEVDEAQAREVEHALLDPLADQYLNKHVAFAAVELVLVRVLPEIGERGVAALIEERLG